MASNNKFKSLSQVLKYHAIHYTEESFDVLKTAKMSEAVYQDIVFTLKEVAYDISEVSICENLIYPIL